MTMMGLLWSSWCDIRSRSVPVWGLVVWGIAALVRTTMTGWSVESVLGLFPGVLLIVLSKITEGIGRADGLILLYLGMALGIQRVIVVFCGSLLLLFVYAMVLFLFQRKMRRKVRSLIPYVPFLLAAYAAVSWIGTSG